MPQQGLPIARQVARGSPTTEPYVGDPTYGPYPTTTDGTTPDPSPTDKVSGAKQKLGKGKAWIEKNYRWLMLVGVCLGLVVFVWAFCFGVDCCLKSRRRRRRSRKSRRQERHHLQQSVPLEPIRLRHENPPYRIQSPMRAEPFPSGRRSNDPNCSQEALLGGSSQRRGGPRATSPSGDSSKSIPGGYNSHRSRPSLPKRPDQIKGGVLARVPAEDSTQLIPGRQNPQKRIRKGEFPTMCHYYLALSLLLLLLLSTKCPQILTTLN